MKTIKKLLSAAVACTALLAGTQAHADVTWQWSYSGDGVLASGTFTTAGMATTPEDILSITGQRNGLAILGLVPLGSDVPFSYDNQFTSTGDHFTSDGLLFDVGGGDTGIINLYFFDGGYTDLYVVGGTDAFETPVTFSVMAVPEASTLAYMAMGLGVVGFGLRRRSAKTVKGELQAA